MLWAGEEPESLIKVYCLVLKDKFKDGLMLSFMSLLYATMEQERKHKILLDSNSLADSIGGQLLYDDSLLDEVSFIFLFCCTSSDIVKFQFLIVM